MAKFNQHDYIVENTNKPVDVFLLSTNEKIGTFNCLNDAAAFHAMNSTETRIVGQMTSLGRPASRTSRKLKQKVYFKWSDGLSK